jgi:GTPase SAR1 family protein
VVRGSRDGETLASEARCGWEGECGEDRAHISADRRNREAQDYLQTRQSTKGVHHDCWENPLGSADATEGRKLAFVVWDYAGQHEYRGTHQCFFTRQALYLGVFDLSEDEGKSAAAAVQWICDIEDRVAGAVFALVGTKADLVSAEEAQRKYRSVLSEVHSYLEQRKEWRQEQLWRSSNTDVATVIPAPVEDDASVWIVAARMNLRPMGASTGFVRP